MVDWLACWTNTWTTRVRLVQCGFEAGKHTSPCLFYLSVLISFVDFGSTGFCMINKSITIVKGISVQINQPVDMDYKKVNATASTKLFENRFDTLASSRDFLRLTQDIKNGYSLCLAVKGGKVAAAIRKLI